MKKHFIILAAAFGLAMTTMAVAPDRHPVYRDPSAPLEARVNDALSRMTTQEKLDILHAQSKFSSRGVPRLGIPHLWTSDGPHGVRAEVLWDEWRSAEWTIDSCIAYPALTCLAATWNPEMARLYGTSIGEEAAYRGKHVILGPGVNIYRTPLNGRNFEYMGEDPYLASKMVVDYVKGVQDCGVAACVKHFALNNIELNRCSLNVAVDDRALYEIYLPAFKAAVQNGNAWSIMGAYNLYKNQHCSHNQYLLNDILKGEWGFDGVVVSDWGGAHDSRECALNGLDLEMGTWTDNRFDGNSSDYPNYHLGNPYRRMLESGEASYEGLDDKARRVLRLIFRTAMNPHRAIGSICSDEHYKAARRIAGEGIVLLKNNNKLLPLKPTDGAKVLVVGENAIKMMTVGGGSSSLKVQHEITPLEGIRKALGPDVTVEYARGYVGDLSNEELGVSTGQNLADSRSSDVLLAEAVAKAKDADYVIFVGGLNKSAHQDTEGSDRLGLGLPYGQDELISALAEANPRMVVVNISGNAVAMPWVDKVPAIMQAWFIGSEAGHAIGDVLTGVVNPSGHLPFTFPRKLDDVSAHALGAYPGTLRNDGTQYGDIEYKEGIYVGYRWFDTKKIKPLFAFGHGLSYTDFAFGKATTDRKQISGDETITFTIPVTNTGSTAGAEVVQLYITDSKSSVDRPAKELKGFAKVFLNPGQTDNVTIEIGRDALSFFDADAHRWVAEPGEFVAHIGPASDNIKTSVKFTLAE